jgi:hypothetical protein
MSVERLTFPLQETPSKERQGASELIGTDGIILAGVFKVAAAWPGSGVAAPASVLLGSFNQRSNCARALCHSGVRWKPAGSGAVVRIWYGAWQASVDI